MASNNCLLTSSALSSSSSSSSSDPGPRSSCRRALTWLTSHSTWQAEYWFENLSSFNLFSRALASAFSGSGRSVIALPAGLQAFWHFQASLLQGSSGSSFHSSPLTPIHMLIGISLRGSLCRLIGWPPLRGPGVRPSAPGLGP